MPSNTNNQDPYHSIDGMSWQKSKVFLKDLFTSSSYVTLRALEAILLGSAYALLTRKFIENSKYISDLVAKFPQVQNFISSPNFIPYCIATAAAIMFAALVISTIRDYRKNFDSELEETKSGDLASSIETGFKKTSPIYMTISMTFSFMEWIGKSLIECFKSRDHSTDTSVDPGNSEKKVVDEKPPAANNNDTKDVMSDEESDDKKINKPGFPDHNLSELSMSNGLGEQEKGDPKLKA